MTDSLLHQLTTVLHDSWTAANPVVEEPEILTDGGPIGDLKGEL